jgi:Carboxylesterase type B
MVYIHGGAFKGGNTRFLKEKFIMDKNIVYVAIQYRIGILGEQFFVLSSRNRREDTIGESQHLKNEPHLG